jgi:hypothetical protein
MAITLPKTPHGEQFEDFVAASLRALGYFIETRVTLREGKKEVLELDIVATPIGGSVENRELYEAKKSAPSFPNLFKLYGQRMYLGIDCACLATLEDADVQYKPIYDAIGVELGIRPCCHKIDYKQLTNLAPAKNSLNDEQRKAVAVTAWYLQIAKRIAQADLVDNCRDNRGVDLYDKLREYVFKVSASFFAKTPLDRAEALYAAYFDHPKLTGDIISALAAEEGLKEVEVWNQLNNTHEHLWLQSQMLAEGVSRVAIIKHALDHVILARGAPLPMLTLKIGTKSYEVVKYNLPPRFVDGLKTLHAHSHSLKLPFLYQTFLELCGGFLFLNSEEDIALLEAISGVPRTEVVQALRLLDEFFSPTGGSMFYTVKNQLLCFKMVPGFVRAIGSILRHKFFAFEDYDEKYPDVGWLLRKWHMAGYTVLSRELPKVGA